MIFVMLTARKLLCLKVERIKEIERDDLVRRDDCNERNAGVDGPIILLVIILRTILKTNILDTRRLNIKK